MAEKTYTTARSLRRTVRIIRLYQRLWSTYSPHGRRARLSLPRTELALAGIRFVARAAFVALLLAALMQQFLPSTPT
jgi:hypothetical protein